MDRPSFNAISSMIQSQLSQLRNKPADSHQQMQIRQLLLQQQQLLEQMFNQNVGQWSTGVRESPRLIYDAATDRLPRSFSDTSACSTSSGLARSFSGGSICSTSSGFRPISVLPLPVKRKFDEDISTPNSTSAFSSASSATPPRSIRSTDCPDRPSKKKMRPYSDEEDEEDGCLTAEAQLAADRKFLLYPVLEFFDAEFLAPRKSKLFARQFRKKRNADGTRTLKEKEDLVLAVLDKQKRRCLRTIMGSAYMNNHILTARYSKALKKIIKRRRNNHMTWWNKYGIHKDLIYGGVGVGGECTRRRRRKTKRTKRKITFAKPAIAPPDMDADFSFDESPADATTVDESPADATTVDESPADATTLDESPPDATTVDESPADATTLDESPPDATTVANDAPPVSNLHLKKTVCADCKKRLTFRSCFPQDHADWDASAKRKVRCGPCWDKFVQTEAMPQMQERIEMQAGHQAMKEQLAKKKTKKQKPKTKKPRKKRTHCKCGSKFHLMTSHLDCPLNKRNLRQPNEDTDPAKAKDVPDVINAKDVAPTDPNPKTKRRRKNKSKKNKRNLRQPNEEAKKDVDTEPTDPAQDVDTPPTDPEPKTDAFLPAINDCVLAEAGRNKFYLAHVTNIVGDVYTVYFPEDGEVEDKKLSQLRPLSAGIAPPLKRADLRDKEFFWKGTADLAKGMFKVSDIDNVKNHYLCERVKPLDKGKNKERFDIGYVMDLFYEQRQCDRER